MATTGMRNTVAMGFGPVPQSISLPVAASAKINQGSLVAVNASGYAEPASTATTLKVIGRAEEPADNTGGANAAIRVEVVCGVFKWLNSGGDAIAQADVFADCFAVDDETVAKTHGSNTRSKAGKVIQVDADGVWVLSGPTA